MFDNHDFRVMESSQSRSFMQRVYGWMALALVVSATTAYVVASSPAFVHALYGNMLLLLVLMIAQVGLVVYLTAALPRMSTGTAVFAYLLYSVLSGLTLSSVFLVYNMQSVVLTLLVTVGMFAAMAVYGQVTNSDLSSLRDFLFMGIIGLIIANVVNMFVASTNFNLITAAFGVMIFTLFTAYDVQQIKHVGSQMLASDNDMFKASLFGALRLYLDFVNLFMYLLRLLGHRRND